MYAKPEVTVLGSAGALIELTAKLHWGFDLYIPHNTIPAYDLDD